MRVYPVLGSALDQDSLAIWCAEENVEGRESGKPQRQGQGRSETLPSVGQLPSGREEKDPGTGTAALPCPAPAPAPAPRAAAPVVLVSADAPPQDLINLDGSRIDVSYMQELQVY